MSNNPQDWREMQRFPKHPADGDGQSCAVDLAEMPAAFYRVRALPDTNSIGAPLAGFMLATGSGTACRDWAVQTARMISRGMVGLESVSKLAALDMLINDLVTEQASRGLCADAPIADAIDHLAAARDLLRGGA